jgi:SAM-dependent methyltransferase
MAFGKWTDHEARAWLETPLGRSLLALETRLVEDALDGVFGEETLQLGHWGEPRALLRYARTQRAAVLADSVADGVPNQALGDYHRLPVDSDSIDSVIMPHTLDFADRPHAILREVHRVLRADGHVLILGFRPGGLWGLRRLVPGAGMPPGAADLLSDRRLKDWLRLLDMRIQKSKGYFFRWPIAGSRNSAVSRWEQVGQRWWSELSACYILSAQKRISTLTPVRPVWSARPKVVAGLEPTTRASRIRFEQDS